MRIASSKTIRNSTKTRRTYAYRAIERATFDCLDEVVEEGEDAMLRFINRSMKKSEQLDWAYREQEYKILTS